MADTKPDEKPALTLTHEQTTARLRDIEDEMSRLERRDDLNDDDEARFGELADEAHSLAGHKKGLERKAALARVKEAARGRAGTVEMPASDDEDGHDGPAFHRSQDPWDLSNVRTYGRSRDEVGAELRGRALAAIEKMPHASDSVRQASTVLVEEGETRTTELVLATSSPDYMGAFTKLMRAKGEVGVLDGAQRDAYTRAMSLTDTAGGFLIPFQLDPTVIITANGSSNPVRQLARVVNVTGDTWHGISSAGVTGSWDDEAAEVSDDAPTLASPSIPVYKGAIFVPISLEAAQDEANVAGEVARMVSFEKDRMESVAFVTGSGSGQPTGIVTALTGGSSVVASATTDTFALADVYALDSALPARYAANASWLAHRAIANLVRRFDTSGGAGLWETLANGLPPRLLGRPYYTAEAMDSSITALSDNLVAIYGDFSNYVIADRVGTTIEYIPHLFGDNGRPTGQRGWYAYFRVGADSVNDAAFRMLNVT